MHATMQEISECSSAVFSSCSCLVVSPKTNEMKLSISLFKIPIKHGLSDVVYKTGRTDKQPSSRGNCLFLRFLSCPGILINVLCKLLTNIIQRRSVNKAVNLNHSKMVEKSFSVLLMYILIVFVHVGSFD